ncbi:CHP02757 [Desulfonema limicola]|uniref:CHP02757 n=1 Tax=Desulfonema limicola TaxID=45656 RepID=A0A975BAI4_9BACT|nr:TIGR02757 family protein [Desulfonema limicola]QTA82039.1 CHP02757 [Desulfonema limicola]
MSHNQEYSIKNLEQKLEFLYKKYNCRKYVHPDPLEFLYNYNELQDREIAGIIASSLAYGRVAQILKSVSHVLDIMGKSPAEFVRNASVKSLDEQFKGFKHRFATGAHISAMLMGAKKIIQEYGSLYECFLSCMNKNDNTIIPGLVVFSEKLSACGEPGHLVPLPQKGSACKRMNLFLRWMVRKDEVDPGGWEEISCKKLIIPLDVHMYNISLKLGLTKRKQANMKTALEITSGFTKLVPHDPVKYDFALTRFGIRDDISYENLDELL